MSDHELTDEEKDLLANVFSADGVDEMHRMVLEAIIESPGDAVAEVDTSNGIVEVWLNTGVTGEELTILERFYDIREFTVYGDPQLAGTPEGDELDGKQYLSLEPLT